MKQSRNADRKTTQLMRKPYIQPTLEQVQLILDDTILFTPCKTAVSGGPNQSPCISIDLGNCLDNAS